jgi:predicted ABC-type ATPase
MPDIILLAGPNGAGKTSFANAYLAAEGNALAFLNADEAARKLASTGLTGAALDLAAGRHTVREIRGLVSQRRDFMVETTLATTTYARHIPAWQRRGFHVCLIYLRLPSAQHSIERVAKRVTAGGHNIPEPVIRRRFAKSVINLEKIYKPIVDEWYIYNSLDGDFELAEAFDDRWDNEKLT